MEELETSRLDEKHQTRARFDAKHEHVDDQDDYANNREKHIRKREPTEERTGERQEEHAEAHYNPSCCRITKPQVHGTSTI